MSGAARTRLEIQCCSGPPVHPPPEMQTRRGRSSAFSLPLLIALGIFSGCSSSKALRPVPAPEPVAAQEATTVHGVPDSTIEESLQWTADMAGAESEAPDEGALQLLETAQNLYRRGLQLYAGGDNVAAEQALTDAGLAVELAAEGDLSEADADELGLLQEKIAFFLDQLAPLPGEAAATRMSDVPDAVTGELAENVTRLPDIELVENDRVRKWLNYFTGRGRQRYQLWLERTGRYRDVIYPILDEEGVPHDLIYLSLIESGMNPTAVSWAKAEGMWQFIKSTARLYNVKMDWWVDERRDPVKSCRAAAQHLRDLYVMFDDWLLAMAAYNSGAGRVQREIRRSKSRDFWVMRLPTQTRDYVPQFMAAALIGRDPQKYGFDPQYHEPLAFDLVEVEGPLSLAAVAKCAGVSADDVCELNPKLRQKAVPPHPKPYLLRVPAGTGEICQAAIFSLTPADRAQYAVKQPPAETLARAERHKVRKGETLSGIARRYGTSPATLARLNGIRERDVIRVGQRLKLPESAKSSRARERERERIETRETADGGTVYVVRRGDTVGEIARRYGMSTRELLRRNNLRAKSRIYPGDELLIAGNATPAPETTVAAATSARPERQPSKAPVTTKPVKAKSAPEPATVAAATTAAKTHTVRRGDTLFDIAQKYGTTMRELELANGLHQNELIRAGDRLVIPGTSKTSASMPAKALADGSGAATQGDVAMGGESGLKLVNYTVKRGDTLGKIAAKFGVRISNLRRWNQLASKATHIEAGQTLKIYVSQKERG